MLLLKPPYLGVLPRDREENPGETSALEASMAWFLMPTKSMRDGHAGKEQASPSHLWHIQAHPDSRPNEGQQRQLGETSARVATGHGRSLLDFTFLTQPRLGSCFTAIWKFSGSDHLKYVIT